jgi:hypothetical protein
MDFLEYSGDSFDSNANIRHLCEELNETLGESIWDTFSIQSTKWLWLVNNVFGSMNSERVQCGAFGLYPSFVAGTLSKVQGINLCVLRNDKIFRPY